MAELVADCPRCGANHITFDVKQAVVTETAYGWQYWYEAFSICRRCQRTSIFVLSDLADGDHDAVHKVGLTNLPDALNNYVDVRRYISLVDETSETPPEHVPARIAGAFNEGARCLAIGCFNAAGTMFRLCLDFATADRLPPPGDPTTPNARERRDLGLRLPWLIAHGQLPADLENLASCVKDDGNDGAHKGTLREDEALDLLDFTKVLLERLYTLPEKARLVATRRDARRSGTAN